MQFKEKGFIIILSKLSKKELECSSLVDDLLRGLTPFFVSAMSIECPLSESSICTSLTSSAMSSCDSSFCSCKLGWTLSSGSVSSS